MLSLSVAGFMQGTFRERMAELCEYESPLKNGEVEVELDESYFGARRVRGMGAWRTWKLTDI